MPPTGPSSTYGSSRQIVAAPTQPGRSRGGVDVAQQRGVEEPVAELRRRAGPYERTGVANGKNAAVGGTGAHAADVNRQPRPVRHKPPHPPWTFGLPNPPDLEGIAAAFGSLDTGRRGMKAAAMRQDLPQGTVTFVFTDIEGSTRLLEELGASVTGSCCRSIIGCVGRRGRRMAGWRWTRQVMRFSLHSRLRRRRWRRPAKRRWLWRSWG